MGLNDTPSGERVQIGIFGRRNAGKSTLFNALIGQEMAVVSDTLGTTTDPVKKAMELLPLGPVVFTDTPGLDDEGELGNKRITKAKEILRKIDMAVICLDIRGEEVDLEAALLSEIKERSLPFLIVLTKTDLIDDKKKAEEKKVFFMEKFSVKETELCLCGNGDGKKVQEGIIKNYTLPEERPLIADKISLGDKVVLVVPIDSAAPKGRLILPQQQVIRDILDVGGIPLVCRESELEETLSSLKNPPKMVITDSQAFGFVSKIVPQSVPLTSFSIIMARYKGDLEAQIKGAKAIEALEEGDKILIAEGCSHRRQCGDIGTVKMPAWIKNYTGKDFEYSFTSGGEYPEDLSEYKLVIHCGGCTLPIGEMRYRISHAVASEIPITNYGVFIAYLHGILDRASEIFM
ncbi:MAG: [FeFe] hydrogenase H-cluster maturation GTPase HydF [Lachnospiraceae bacterium]|nr:[FeFe] hydrogenase H-cluster maturation GTPase HydF [Lachnospiraceae bacterium]